MMPKDGDSSKSRHQSSNNFTKSFSAIKIKFINLKTQTWQDVKVIKGNSSRWVRGRSAELLDVKSQAFQRQSFASVKLFGMPLWRNRSHGCSCLVWHSTKSLTGYAELTCRVWYDFPQSTPLLRAWILKPKLLLLWILCWRWSRLRPWSLSRWLPHHSWLLHQ